MSSILEALKKLEEEKAARRGGAGDLAGRVTSAGRRPKQANRMAAPAIMVVVVIVAVVTTFALMGGFTSRSSAPASPSPPQEPAVPAQVAPAPPVPAPVASSETQAPAHLLPPAFPSRAAAVPQPAAPPLAPAPMALPSPIREEPVEDAPPAATPQPATALPAQAPAPAFKVTGIAWQKDEASRLAVVNGSPVSEGSVVDGAVVVQILPDRVRFALNRKEFDVVMGKPQ